MLNFLIPDAMSNPTFTVIGISDSRRQRLADDAMHTIRSASVFSGGKRHYEIVKSMLPEDHKWIDITIPISNVFDQYAKENEVVVFASGDPLFYGMASTLRREFPKSQMKVLPTLNSIQMLACRMLIPYHDIKCVSLTGRPWSELDQALIAGYDLIGVLTDRIKTPVAISHRLIEYGYTNYEMIVGEKLGNETDEKTYVLSLHDADRIFAMPNNVILRKTSPRNIPFGIPDDQFAKLPGRDKMITKMPVRLLSISMLDLAGRHSLWDIGFCTGSISIEAKLRYPALKVTSFEIRPESESLMHQNCRKFGIPDINIVMGDFLKVDLSDLPRPDAIFIGGHGGKLKEIIERILPIMQPDGVIVFNSVSSDSLNAFTQCIESSGLRIVDTHRIALDDYNPITIMKAQ